MVFAAFISFGSLYHVIGPLCRRLLAATCIFVLRILICGLYRFLVLCVCVYHAI